MRAPTLIIALVLTLLATLAVVLLALRSRRQGPGSGGVVPAFIAVTSTVLVGIGLLAPAVGDSGVAFAAAVLTFPVLITVATVYTLWRHRRAGAVVAWAATVVMGGYVLLFALGFGMYYVPTALLLLAAAIVRTGR